MPAKNTRMGGFILWDTARLVLYIIICKTRSLVTGQVLIWPLLCLVAVNSLYQDMFLYCLMNFFRCSVSSPYNSR